MAGHKGFTTSSGRTVIAFAACPSCVGMLYNIAGATGLINHLNHLNHLAFHLHMVCGSVSSGKR
jgi:hypothetical protein